MSSAMRLIIFMAAAGMVRASNVNIEGAFLKVCSNFCKAGGGFDHCDIGNGNLLVGSELNASAHRPRDQSCDKCGSLWLWDHCSNPAWMECMAKSTTTPVDMKYSNIQSKVDSAAKGFVFVYWVDNNSTVSQSTTLDLSETTSASASLTLSTTIDVGYEIDVKAGLPDIFETTFKEKFDMKTTQTSKSTQTSSQTWSVSQPVIAPPRSTMKVTLIVVKSTVSADWTSQMSWGGVAKVWCHNQVNGHWEWFYSADDFLPAAYPGDCSGNTCTLRGRFEGWHGVNTQVKIQQCELGSRSCGSAEMLI